MTDNKEETGAPSAIPAKKRPSGLGRGLNALFFAVRGIMGMFKFLKHGVSVILLFIGGKMIAGAYPPIDEWFRSHNAVSLLVIGLLLLIAVVASVWHERLNPAQKTAEKKPDELVEIIDRAA